MGEKIMGSAGKKIVCGGTTANIVARAINHVHQMADISNDLSIKLYVLNEMKNILVKLGKIIEIEYY